MATKQSRLVHDMIRIHKVITRGIMIGLNKGNEFLTNDLIQPDMKIGYSYYIQSLASILKGHHMSEDEVSFPAFQKVLPGAPFSQFAIDHHKIEALLAPLSESIKDLSEDKLNEGLKTIVDTLGKISTIWHPHIRLEEQNFSDEVINKVLNEQEQQEINQATGKYSQEHSGPAYWIIPFILFNLEPEERALMAATIPSNVMNDLIPNVWKDQWAPMKPYLLD